QAPPPVGLRFIVDVREESDAAVIGVGTTGLVEHRAVQGKAIDEHWLRPRAARGNADKHDQGHGQPESLHQKRSPPREWGELRERLAEAGTRLVARLHRTVGRLDGAGDGTMTGR